MISDKKSLRLLYELDRNSRASFTKLGRVTGMAEDTVRYPVKALKQQGVIQRFNTVVDTARFGYTFHKVFFKLHSATEEVISRFVEYLVSQSIVNWVVRLEGQYHLAIALQVRRLNDLSQFFDTIAADYNQFIGRKSFAVNILIYYFTHDYLLDQERVQIEVKYYTAETEHSEIDTIDRHILFALGDNSRVSATALSAELKKKNDPTLMLSAGAVQQRIKRMEREKIITGYNLVLNHHEMGYSHYKVLLFLNPVPGEEIESFLEDIRLVPQVIYQVKTLGEWDYELDIVATDGYQFREITMEVMSRHPDVVRDYISLMVTDVYKYNNVSMLAPD